MPWLSSPNNLDECARPDSSATKEHTDISRSLKVNFIPAQIDGLCGTAPSHHRQAASTLLRSDVGVFLRSMSFLPSMGRSISSMKAIRSYFSSILDTRDTMLQLFLVLLHYWMIIVAVPAILILPTLLFAAAVCICWLVTLGVTWPMTGPRVWTSSQERALMTGDHTDERWIYINGLGCSNHALQNHCRSLSRIFGRQIIGVHNPTSGLIVDLFSIFYQRCFNLSTPSTLTLMSQIRDACLTNSVCKVILIGHSTGALHISIALEQLHASLPIDVLSKLEIYTFGSAAAYISNPCLRMENTQGLSSNGNLKYTRPDGSIASPVKVTLASLGHRVEDHERVIPHIEHYAFASDIFARFGVIQNTRNVLDNRFCGRVFILDDTKAKRRWNSNAPINGGFLMDQHYLNLLFGKNNNKNGDVLDAIVTVDTETAEKREFTALGFALPRKSIFNTSISADGNRNMIENTPSSSNSIDSINGTHVPNQNSTTSYKSRASSPEISPFTCSTNHHSNSHSRSLSTTNPSQIVGSTAMSHNPTTSKSTRRTSWEIPSQCGLDDVAKARTSAKECEGRSIRQLSRLWRYAGGARPVGEGVPVTNGVGVGYMGNGAGLRVHEERKLMNGGGVGSSQRIIK